MIEVLFFYKALPFALELFWSGIQVLVPIKVRQAGINSTV